MWFRKNKEPKPIDNLREEVNRLCGQLKLLDPRDPAYGEILERITTLQTQMSNDKTIRRRVHPETKKVIATGATIAGLIGLNYYLDNKGEAISGKAQRIGENLLSQGTRMLNIFKF